MERIENPMVLGHTPYDEKPLRHCDCCGDEMYAGDKYHKVDDKYYCDNCVETGELEEEEPDWDSMPGGYDDWRE